RFATGTVDRLDLLPRPQQAAAGAARGRVDDDPRALRGSGPGDRRPPQPLPARRPGGRPPHGPPAPRARRTLRRGLVGDCSRLIAYAGSKWSIPASTADD